MSGLRIGLSLTTAFSGDPRQAAHRLLEQVRLAHEVGLDSIELGDHHVHPTGYLQNVPLIGRLLAEWPDRSVLMLALLPLWPPVLLAEQLSTLSALTHAQFSLCAGLGYVPAEFDAFGVDRGQRISLFERSVASLRALLAEQPADGGIQIAPRPTAPTEILAAAGVRAGVERASRLGLGWLAPPTLSEDELGELCRVRDGSTSAGAARSVVRRDGHIDEDEAIDRIGAEVRSTGYRGLPVDRLVIAGVGQAIESCGRIADLGFDEISARPVAQGQSNVLRCIERLGEVRGVFAQAAQASA